MSNLKRFLLLGSLGVVLLAGLMWTSNTHVSTAHANGCTTIAEGYKFINTGSYYEAHWNNTCTVSQGNISNAVYGIQLDINEAKLTDPKTGKYCTVGTVDGDFGPNTFNGVECFQRAYNTLGVGTISVDGIVGPQTWGALSIFPLDLNRLTTGWNYFSVGTAPNNFRMWGQSPYKWSVNAGGCWRQMDENSSACG